MSEVPYRPDFETSVARRAHRSDVRPRGDYRALQPGQWLSVYEGQVLAQPDQAIPFAERVAVESLGRPLADVELLRQQLGPDAAELYELQHHLQSMPAVAEHPEGRQAAARRNAILGAKQAIEECIRTHTEPRFYRARRLLGNVTKGGLVDGCRYDRTHVSEIADALIELDDEFEVNETLDRLVDAGALFLDVRAVAQTRPPLSPLAAHRHGLALAACYRRVSFWARSYLASGGAPAVYGTVQACLDFPISDPDDAD